MQSKLNGRFRSGPIPRLLLVFALLLTLAFGQVCALNPGRCNPDTPGRVPVLLLKDDNGEIGESVGEKGEFVPWIRCERDTLGEAMFAVEDEVGCEFWLECATVGPLPPRPTTAQPTSIPDLIDHNQTNPNTGVLIRTFKTGKMSGYRAGGWMTNSNK